MFKRITKLLKTINDTGEQRMIMIHVIRSGGINVSSYEKVEQGDYYPPSS